MIVISSLVMDEKISKRKQHPSSTSSVEEESPSVSTHLEKKPRNLSGDESSDEVVQVLNFAESMSDRFNVILQKLEKLDTLDTIEAKLTDVELAVKGIESRLEKVEASQRTGEQKTTELEAALSFIDNSLKADKQELIASTEGLKGRVEDLKSKTLYLEAYGRRENLIFYGIPEQQSSETAENTRNVWNNFLKSTMGLVDPEGIEIQRIHRLWRRKNGNPRPIIVRFLRYADRETIWNNRKKLRGSSVQMFEDFPTEIIEARRRQVPLMKEAWRQGKKAYFSRSQPDKLYVDGQLVK